jgi:hypothetical protein
MNLLGEFNESKEVSSKLLIFFGVGELDFWCLEFYYV